MNTKKYNVVSTRAVEHTISPVNGVISSAIVMKPTEFHCDVMSDQISILVNIADMNGKMLNREVIPYKISTLLGILGGISLADFIANIDQLLIDVIDLTNSQYIQAGSPKRVFYGLLKNEMELVEIIKPNYEAPRAE